MKRSAWFLVSAAIVVILSLCLTVSCGHKGNGADTVGSGLAPTGRGDASRSAGAPRHAPTIPLAAVLAQIDAYPVPKGMSAQTWATLTAELKRRLVARAVDGKHLSIAPTGAMNAVTDLAAVSNSGGTQAIVTWTEKLWGDCNNDGQVDVGDLLPIASHYGETSTGPGSAAYLADTDGDGRVDITDLQPIAANYGAHLQGYQIWRGSYNGTTIDWETTFRPNVDNPANTAFSADRPATPPAPARPTYTYTDDISSLVDKTHLRYKVTAYGDGAAGAESNEASMLPAPTFSVLGSITLDSTGLGGVTVTLSPGSLSTTSASDGTYTITGVSNGTYTLKPSLSGYRFSPASRLVTVAGANVMGQAFSATDTFTISGSVLVAVTTAPLSGVTLTLAPGGLNATTGAGGAYAIPGVPDGSYTLTPSLAGYVFNPVDRPVIVSGADLADLYFIATETYSVSGTVTDNAFSPIAGVTMTLATGGPNATTLADGTYVIAGVTPGSYRLVPSKAGTAFTPPSRLVVLAGADVTGQDFIGEASGLAGTPWPKFRGNPRNTGQSPYVGARTGQIKWRCNIGNAVLSSPAVPADGTLYVGGYDACVYALNPVDGTTKWLHGTGGAVCSSPAIGVDGTVFVGSEDYCVYALNPVDGSVRWSYKTGGWVDSSPAIGADGTIYIGSADGDVYALYPSDGALKWSHATGAAVFGSPSVAADGKIFVGSDDRCVYALSPVDGSVVWVHETGNVVRSSPAIGADATVYIGSFDSKVYALNPTTGSVKWTLTTFNDVYGSPAIATDGTVYIGSRDENVYAVDPVDGNVKWMYPTAGWVDSSPAIGADGVVYIGSNDGTVYALIDNGANAGLMSKFQTGSLAVSGPAIGADGTVYIGSYDGDLYAFGP